MDKTPVAKTKALGGVATGSMKAKEAAAATGSMRYRGLSPKSRACKYTVSAHLHTGYLKVSNQLTLQHCQLNLLDRMLLKLGNL